MLRDARALEDGSIVEADLAIVGAGAAGIAIARTFIGSRIRVALVESGGLDFDPDTQDLYRGRNIGQPYYDLDITRLRYFGGSTNHWVGRSRHFDPIDFEQRPWVPHSGWPISFDEFMAYLEPAQEACRMGPGRYEPAFWEIDDRELLPLEAAVIRNLVWQFSPISFGEAYRDELERAAEIDVLLHASVVDIATDPEAREVRSLEVATLAGRRFLVRAQAYVLACGGLENPRLLLASRSVQPEGLGNGHDLVGRFFMEHPHLPTGQILVTDAQVDYGLYAGVERRGLEVMPHLSVAPDLQRQARILNWQGHLTHDRIGDSGYAAFRRIVDPLRRGRWPDDLSGDLWRTVRDIDDTVAGLLGRLGWREYAAPNMLLVFSHGESAPNPDSRVLLDEEDRDALGMPRIRLDWRLAELDLHTITVVHEHLARQLGQSGSGRLRVRAELEASPPVWPDDLSGGHHHMGTTRMSDDPRRGVVDPDCRVHGIANLYIAGSSVFPTAGCVNPTLNLVMLALRLADHLKERLRA